MARIVTPPATVTQPAAHALDAPNGRSGYPLARPAYPSHETLAYPDGPVTRALRRLASVRLQVTAVRIDLAGRLGECRSLAESLRSDMLLCECRADLGLVALYVGPRPTGLGADRRIESRIGEELTRVLVEQGRYELLRSARVAMAHCAADLLSDGLLEPALAEAPSCALVELVPQAA